MTNREYAQRLVHKAVERINKGVSKTLTARLSSEIPPLDSRHLTDTRTRVSTLLEYALAYELNNLLVDEREGRSASAVLWNVFPDLVIRDSDRQPKIGLEVKALHTAAEEKSANLSTPLHVIKRGSDFVVIVIWAWRRETIGVANITYPHIHAAELFDAYLLAQMRDYSWLFKQGDRIKGIDISTPLISPEDRPKGDQFKAEEGNMGKLMRIDLESRLPVTTPGLKELQVEAEQYSRFKNRAVMLGLTETFREICDLQHAKGIQCDSFETYPANLTEIGHAEFFGRTISLFAGGGKRKLLSTRPDPSVHKDGAIAVWLSPRLNWTILRCVHSTWIELESGNKPDTAYERIQAAIGAGPET